MLMHFSNYIAKTGESDVIKKEKAIMILFINKSLTRSVTKLQSRVYQKVKQKEVLHLDFGKWRRKEMLV